MAGYNHSIHYWLKFDETFLNEMPVRQMLSLPKKEMPHIFAHFMFLVTHAIQHGGRLINDDGEALTAEELALIVRDTVPCARREAEYWLRVGAIAQDEDGLLFVPSVTRRIDYSTFGAEERQRRRKRSGGQSADKCPPDADICPPIERENKERDTEIESESEKDATTGGADVLTHTTAFKSYGSFGNIRLTEGQHASLFQEFENAVGLIEKRSRYYHDHPEQDHGEHYKTICSYAVQDGWPRRKQPTRPAALDDTPDERKAPPEHEEKMRELCARLTKKT